MSVFVNQTVNLKKIKAIGFDMDYTLVRYQSEPFEQLAYGLFVQKLIALKRYPQEILKLKFDFSQAIRGLVIDKKRGNLLKLNLYGKIKSSSHGTIPHDYKERRGIYKGKFIDLNDSNYSCIDTTFSIAQAVLYAQLVNLKDLSESSGNFLYPSYQNLFEDLLEVVDLTHRDDSLKGEVRKNPERYVIQDENTVQLLQRFREFGKKLFLITNSDFSYTNFVMEYSFGPYLKKQKWYDLFESVITLAAKPHFFTHPTPFLTIDKNKETMTNTFGPLTPFSIYQGGNAHKLQEDFNLRPEEILYMGDHIYGDVLSLKKASGWRTALVIEELSEEIQGVKNSQELNEEIHRLMQEKSLLEQELNLWRDKEKEEREKSKSEIARIFKDIDQIDSFLAEKLGKINHYFNSTWGEMMRSGSDESYFAGQVAKYACLYMAKVSDLIEYSPYSYFRPLKRYLPHEILNRNPLP